MHTRREYLTRLVWLRRLILGVILSTKIMVDEAVGVNMLDVKQVNAEVVLWELWALRTASVKELSQRTGLSFATVASILSGFVETGEVVLGGRLSGTGGRPSQAYVFNAEFAHILALSAQVRNGTHLIRSSVGTSTVRPLPRMRRASTRSS